MNLPSPEDFRYLLELARAHSPKNRMARCSSRISLINCCEEMARGLVREKVHDNDLLAMKYMAYFCLKELTCMHKEVVRKYFDDRDEESAIEWMQDAGKIDLICDCLASVSVGSEDWLAQ